MGPEFNPKREPNRDDMPRLMAEDFGLEGRRFLHQNESNETIEALGQILTAELLSRYVCVEEVKALHSSITDEMAQREAFGLSKQLLWGEVKEMLDKGAPISMSDMDQVFAGSAMATREALVTVCLGMGLRTGEVLEEARARGWRSGPME